MSHQKEQKTIAKNTVFLYLRMFLVMFVSLYTSRVVLDKLGVENYGIYNIVGSIVVSFIFVQHSLMSSTQRFLSYSIGSGDKDCHRVFSVSMNIHIVIMVVLLFLLESIGTYCLYYVLNIPTNRLSVAFVVFQLSIASFCVNMLRLPYNTLVVSRERMSIYAYYSIIDVFLKLSIAYMISIDMGFDKLVLYAILMLIVTICSSLYIVGYCRFKLTDDVRYVFIKDKKDHKEMLSFASWNLIGGLTGVASSEGPNYFMNFYLGVAVNAAMGVAKQVSTAIYTFSSSFQQAFNPQIVKSYANKDLDYMFSLIFRTSKLSFYLIFVIAAPFIVCCDDVLGLWLVETPKYANAFCICMLTTQMVAALSSPFWMAAHAIGNIKNYQLVISISNLCVIPISYIVLSLGYEPYYILSSLVILNIVILIYRCEYLYRKIKFPHYMFYSQVFLRVFVSVPCIILPLLLIISKYFVGFERVCLISIFSLTFTTFVFAYVGMTSSERSYILNLIKSKARKP